MKSLREQSGHTLMELMITLALSLYLMAGLLQTLFANKQTFLLIAEEARMNNNGLFVMQMLEEHIKRAGYRNEMLVAGENLALQRAFPPTEAFFTSAAVAGRDNISGENNIKPGTDLLRLRYQSAGDGLFKDCRGANLDREHGTVTMSFFIDADNQFRCRGRVNAGGGRPSAVLVDGVSQFQILYRIKETTDNQGYLNAAQVDALGEHAWRSVVAVKIALITQQRTISQEQLHDVLILDTEVSLPSDRRLWKHFERVFILENRRGDTDEW